MAKRRTTSMAKRRTTSMAKRRTSREAHCHGNPIRSDRRSPHMSRTTQLFPSRLNRRAALGGVGAAAAALGLGQLDRATAQDATPMTAGHPLVGTWLIMSPPGATVATFAADGSAELG